MVRYKPTLWRLGFFDPRVNNFDDLLPNFIDRIPWLTYPSKELLLQAFNSLGERGLPFFALVLKQINDQFELRYVKIPGKIEFRYAN